MALPSATQKNGHERLAVEVVVKDVHFKGEKKSNGYGLVAAFQVADVVDKGLAWLEHANPTGVEHEMWQSATCNPVQWKRDPTPCCCTDTKRNP